MNDYILYIGRFQPFHNGHYASVKHALSISKKLIIILGGYQLSPCITDPWTVMERKKMILSVLSKTEQKRVEFIFVRDRLYNETLWKENVTHEVKSITKGNTNIALIGHIKDDTSYYLKIFPQWQYIETGNFYGLNGTHFRQKYFSEAHPSYNDVPHNVAKFLKDFRKGKVFKQLQKEFHFFYTQQPTKPSHFSFILLQIGQYLLLEKRDQFPGKNLYSLPLLQSVSLQPKEIQYRVAQQTFYLPKYDGANRLGKEVHFYRIPFDFALNIYRYTSVKQNWILLDDFYLMENKMFADHYQIIKTLMR